MTPFELGWFVGIMEGEGSFIMTNNGRRPEEMIMLVVAMTDEDTIQHVHEVAGCGRVNGPYMGKGRVRPIWRWRTRNRDDVVTLVKAVLPYLSERRTEQASRLLEWDRTAPRRYARGARSTLEASHVAA